jgi:hypothetical protein
MLREIRGRQQFVEARDLRRDVLQQLGHRHRAIARDGLQHVLYDLLPVPLPVQKPEHGKRHDQRKDQKKDAGEQERHS